MGKKIAVDEAVGMTLAHDLTRVIPGKFKGVAFPRGHVVREEDIPMLLDMGKRYIYVLELLEGEIHEEDAARRIATALAGSGLDQEGPREGRINLKAQYFGILKINLDLLREINMVEDVILSTLSNYSVCSPGTTVAGTKIVPLYSAVENIETVESLCRQYGRALEIIPFREKKVGVIITGSEVFEGRIEDGFGAIIKEKVEKLGSQINDQKIVPDDIFVIAQAIRDMRSKGNDVIVVCGGLSVDPDDVTYDGVVESGANIISYGSPVLPGAMFLYAILGDIPVLGAPANVIFDKATVFDLILPRVLAGEKVEHADIAMMGEGGLCLRCSECRYPICPFGR
ncbi:MAG: molybdopterin-binding protein [Deltaproteobacteria bacterium]|nr:molybdopterin-binding protein [Deltaproteobacteria bacterium]